MAISAHGASTKEGGISLPAHFETFGDRTIMNCSSLIELAYLSKRTTIRDTQDRTDAHIEQIVESRP